jgi:hypothetical protein
MKKDSFEKEMKDRDPIAFSFSDISSKIPLDSYAKPQKKRKWGWILGGGAGLLSAGCAIALCVLFLQPHASLPGAQSSSGGTDWATEEGNVQAIAIQNPEELVTEYEKNAAFIGDGLLLGETFRDGKKKFVASTDYVIDSSAFQSGVVGTYSILLSLKRSPTIRTSYSTQVVDDTITGVTLGEYRSVYYLGETPRPQDLILKKVCQSGTAKEAKPAEYEIDTSHFDSKTLGAYSLTAKLKSNPAFSVDYSVEVKPLVEADLDGRYAYLDDETDYGCPTIYAFAIDQDSLTSHYSEIGSLGKLSRSLKSDGTMLLSGGGSQTMIYLPESRTLRVSGIAGDPDLNCFRFNRTDLLISLVGAPADESETRYLAIDGRIPTSTLDYLAYRFGGAYLDLEMNKPITHETLFSSDSTIYVGVKPSVNAAKPFLGVWYREDALCYRRVAFQIAETSLSVGYGTPTIAYSVEDKGNGDYWLRGDQMENLIYHSTSDLLDILDYDTGKTYLCLKRYNPSVQSLVKIVTDMGTTYGYVVDKGSSLPTQFVGEISLTFFKFTQNDYHGEALYEDRTFNGVRVCQTGLSDIDGIYGTLADHLEIVGSFLAGHFPSPHTYWCEFTENYQIVKSGWVGYGDCQPLLGLYELVIHFDDGTEDTLSYDQGAKTLKTAAVVARANATPWKDLPCLGRYEASDGSILLASESGELGVYKSLANGGASINYITTRITSVGDSEVKGYTVEEDATSNRIVSDVLFELQPTGWVLSYGGVAYTWKSAE